MKNKSKVFAASALSALVMLTPLGVYAQTAETVMTADNPVADLPNDVVITPDRFESFNRGAFQFNDGWDQVLFKPIAKGYQKVVPASSRGCVHGFFENLGVPYTAVNNVLQGKFKAAGQDMCRFVVNTTVGVGGCFDMATKWKIPKHDEDFGQTLGKWGVPSGPFVMLPVLGPTTLRDAFAKPLDMMADPIGYLKVVKVKNSLRGLKFVDTRTNLLETLDFVEDVAIDRYSMLRDAWLQKRQADVNDEDYAPDEAPIASTPEVTATEAKPADSKEQMVPSAVEPSQTGAVPVEVPVEKVKPSPASDMIPTK